MILTTSFATIVLCIDLLSREVKPANTIYYAHTKDDVKQLRQVMKERTEPNSQRVLIEIIDESARVTICPDGTRALGGF